MRRGRGRCALFVVAMDCGETVLVALVNGEPGLRKVAGLALLSLSALFGVGLFGGQWAAPEKFGNTFFGEDFVYLYASAELVLDRQGPAVYDPTSLSEKMGAVLEEAGSSRRFVGAMEYWLAFLVPFFPLTLFPLRLAYYIWTGLTVVLFLFGAWRLARAVGVAPWPFWAITLGFFPVISGLLQGQVHGLQFVALVEFWLAERRRAERAAGLWLSFSLVKPQFLPLLVLYVLWQRRWRALAWFIAAGLLWLVLTVFLIGGTEGVFAHARMTLDNVLGPDAPVGVQNMVNWRALAVVWFGAGGVSFAAIITAVFSLLTAGFVIWSWRRWPARWAGLAPQAFVILVGATLLVGYDTQIYSVILVLPPMLALLVHIAKTPTRVGQRWSMLLDFVLVAPSLLALALIPFAYRTVVLPLVWLVLPWFVAAQALLLGLIAMFLFGMLALINEHEHPPADTAGAPVWTSTPL